MRKLKKMFGQIGASLGELYFFYRLAITTECVIVLDVSEKKMSESRTSRILQVHTSQDEQLISSEGEGHLGVTRTMIS